MFYSNAKRDHYTLAMIKSLYMGSHFPQGNSFVVSSTVCSNIYLPKTESFTLIILTNLQQLPKKPNLTKHKQLISLGIGLIK